MLGRRLGRRNWWSWDKPIEGFVEPAIEIVDFDRMTHQASLDTGRPEFVRPVGLLEYPFGLLEREEKRSEARIEARI